MAAEFPEIRWIEPADNPWGVRLLDVRPVTEGMLSTSSDPDCAANALSFLHDDGSGFAGMEPNSSRMVSARLRYRIDETLADGALFIPTSMEHKWALFYRDNRILVVRSWTRELFVTVEVVTRPDEIEITAIRGDLVEQDEDPAFKIRVLDYMMRSHALKMVYPTPLPPELDQHPHEAVLWCFQGFGNRALFATPDEVRYAIPEQPLRTQGSRKS